MRILRLYAPRLTGDHTLCWASNNAGGKTCINEVETALRLSYAGEIPPEQPECSLVIVLPREAKLNDGHFLSVDGCETLLRWKERDKAFEIVCAGFLSVSAKVSLWAPLQTAVLTVSDKGSRGKREDTAGPALVSLASSLGCVVEDKKIVPDEMEEIKEAVSRWSDEGYNLVLITGGTGLSPRDVTPEALTAVAEKIVPGFGETMRSQTMLYTPRAFLTRSLAVIRKKTLIIAFPGSEKAVRQCFEAISEGLRHGVETLAGIDGECGGHGHSGRH